MGLSYLQGPHHSDLARPTGSFSNQPLETETGHLANLRDVLTWSRGVESQKVTTVARRKNKLRRDYLLGSRGGKEIRSERDTQASKVLINLFLRLSSRSKGLTFIVPLRLYYRYLCVHMYVHMHTRDFKSSRTVHQYQKLATPRRGMGLSCN